MGRSVRGPYLLPSDQCHTFFCVCGQGFSLGRILHPEPSSWLGNLEGKARVVQSDEEASHSPLLLLVPEAGLPCLWFFASNNTQLSSAHSEFSGTPRLLTCSQGEEKGTKAYSALFLHKHSLPTRWQALTAPAA